jgi:hypothetical protein
MPATLIDQPVLAALLRYWDEKRGGRPMPPRQAIDPLEMGPRLLPHLMLCDMFDRGTRLRYRLVGTQVVKQLGFDPTKQWLDAPARGGYFDLLAGLHRVVYCERAPLYSASVFRWDAKRRMDIHQLLLPLTNGASEPAIALVGIVCTSTEAFPPSLRTLDRAGNFVETERSAVSAPSSSSWTAAPGRNVA